MDDDLSLELNTPEKPSMNRGVELLLRNKNRVTGGDKPKTFQVKFGKLVSFFGREIDLSFNFHLDFKKKS